MPSTTANATIDVLREIFATHGLPEVVVSDNGPQFTSSEFKSFLERNAIRQVLIAPRRPAANGQAERTVQTVKDSLRRIIQGSWRKRLANFLLQQHCTPTTTTGTSPAELLMGRRVRTILDSLHPDLTEERRVKQEISYREGCEDRGLRQFQENDSVLLRNYNPGPRWIPATVIEATGPVSYQARTEDGQIKRCHVDQMLRRNAEPPFPTILENPAILNKEPSSQSPLDPTVLKSCPSSFVPTPVDATPSTSTSMHSPEVTARQGSSAESEGSNTRHSPSIQHSAPEPPRHSYNLRPRKPQR